MVSQASPSTICVEGVGEEVQIVRISRANS